MAKNINDTGTYQGIAVRIEAVNADGTLNLVATSPSSNPQRFASADPALFTATP